MTPPGRNPTARRLSLRPTSFLCLAALAAACATAADVTEGDLNVTLRDGVIELSTTSVAPGEVTLVGLNQGTMTHELELYLVPNGVDANALPMDGNVARADDNMDLIDEVEDVAPGTFGERTVTLEPGQYAVIYNLPGHYASGMHATFTVA